MKVNGVAAGVLGLLLTGVLAARSRVNGPWAGPTRRSVIVRWVVLAVTAVSFGFAIVGEILQ